MGAQLFYNGIRIHGEHRPYKGVCLNTIIMECFYCINPCTDWWGMWFKYFPYLFIISCNCNTNLYVAKFLKQVNVTQDQRRFCEYTDGELIWQEDFKPLSCKFIFPFYRLVGVCYWTDGDT